MTWKLYRKTGTIFARPYEPGESLFGISVSENDKHVTKGWIAANPNNLDDRWFINDRFFEDNYVEDIECTKKPNS